MNRRSITWLFLTLSLAFVGGQLASLRGRDGMTSFFSANDRSRWATVVSLVENGSYEIDSLTRQTHPTMRNRRPFDTIDKVMHRGSDGQFHAYSSKPPLLATLVACVYAPIHYATPLSIRQFPSYTPKIVLALVNGPLLASMILCVMSAASTRMRSRWSWAMAATGISLCTLVSAMAVSLNNHLFAAAATSWVLALFMRLNDSSPNHPDPKRSKFSATGPLASLLAGGSAALAVVAELPALSMLCVWLVLFAWRDRRTVPGFLAGALSVAGLATACNGAAHGSWRVPYAHRGVGETLHRLAEFDPSAATEFRPRTLEELINAPEVPAGAFRAELEQRLGPGPFRYSKSDEANRWRLQHAGKDYAIVRIMADGDTPVADETVEEKTVADAMWVLARWDDWYEYPGSYWQEGRRVGVDLGEPDRARYAFHMLLGRYGVFSLTPMWCLVPLGLWVAMRPLWRHSPVAWFTDDTLRSALAPAALALGIAVVTLTCIAFYIARPVIDRNYGGVSVGFRWLFWLAPLWWWAACGTLDTWGGRSKTRWGKVWVVALLAASFFSVVVSIDNPWQPPWIVRLERFFSG
ncbi:MAG: hypothetical protein AAF958_18915 [Planctomycetota bacterium]